MASLTPSEHPNGLAYAHAASYLLDAVQHSGARTPASELDADADDDMSFAAAYVPPQPVAPPRNNKIDLNAVDPVLYGLRRSVSLSKSSQPTARLNLSYR